MSEPIQVWPNVDDLPSFFKNKIEDPSDIDWIAYVPPGYENTYIDFLDCASNVDLEKILINNRGFMVISYHA